MFLVIIAICTTLYFVTKNQNPKNIQTKSQKYPNTIPNPHPQPNETNATQTIFINYEHNIFDVSRLLRGFMPSSYFLHGFLL